MIIALNNKSNLNKKEYLEYQQDLANIKSNSELILCPTHLNIANYNLTNFKLGAQNVSASTKGAHTGEISADQLKSYDVEYCIVGHSERRQEQKESLEAIRSKINNLYNENIIPILCIGETLEERKENKVQEILEEEIITATKELTEEQKEKLIVAYEPIWSIGTGLIPTNEEISETLTFIKDLLPTTKVLYGGSANEKNIEILKQCSEIDGYLLGGLSLKPLDLQKFIEILEN